MRRHQLDEPALARVSNLTVFLDLGRLVEFNETGIIFINPREKQMED